MREQVEGFVGEHVNEVRGRSSTLVLGAASPHMGPSHSVLPLQMTSMSLAIFTIPTYVTAMLLYVPANASNTAIHANACNTAMHAYLNPCK